MLVKDDKMQTLVNKLIPNLDQFQEFEQYEAKREFHSEAALQRKKEYK